jgi:hypothetical protein
MSKKPKQLRGMDRPRVVIENPALEVTVSFKFTVDEGGRVGGVIDVDIKGIEELADPINEQSVTLNPAIRGLRDALLRAMGAVSVRTPAQTSRQVGRA